MSVRSQWIPREVGGGPVKRRSEPLVPQVGGLRWNYADWTEVPPPPTRKEKLLAEMESDPFEKLREDVLAFGACSECLGVSVAWREAALRTTRSLRVSANAPLHGALAAVGGRPALLCLDLSGCHSFDADVALAKLHDIFRRRETKLNALRLVHLTKLTRRSRQTCQRLGMKSWAFPTSTLEPGALLISRAHFVTPHSNPHFVRAVVLVFSHGAQGTLGLIINKHSPLQLSPLVAKRLGVQWSVPCTDSLVFFGGDSGEDVSILHRNKELGGWEIVDGLFICRHPDEVARAAKFVQWGKLRPDDCRWFLGLCSWGAGELQQEIGQGLWRAVHGDPDCMLCHSSTVEEMWSDLQKLAFCCISVNEG